MQFISFNLQSFIHFLIMLEATTFQLQHKTTSSMKYGVSGCDEVWWTWIYSTVEELQQFDAKEHERAPNKAI